ncbi:MAG: hypothetical protein KC443_07700 [Anaerolineales bacterium]|nr:hypothetical protein [Anaerolineales bacterium]
MTQKMREAMFIASPDVEHITDFHFRCQYLGAENWGDSTAIGRCSSAVALVHTGCDGELLASYDPLEDRLEELGVEPGMLEACDFLYAIVMILLARWRQLSQLVYLKTSNESSHGGGFGVY